jgi:hypothetical protein
MKKILFYAMLLLGMAVYSQQKEEKLPGCGTDQFLNSLRQKNPEISRRLAEMDKKINSHKPGLNKSINTITPATITIPIVVYIVHNNGPENITDTQVWSQINKLNSYFSPYGIKFCLSTTNGLAPLPGSVSNPGIIRIANAALTDVDADTEHAALTATSTLSNSHFLRIWVVKSINNGGASGYSILPETVIPAQDGIVMSYRAFGDSAACSCTTLSPSTQTGKILVHEVGHYLGLYHTFEGGCAGMSVADCESSGDKVCDTPPVHSSNAGCTVINSCTEASDLPDDINNYMDYTNETCLNHFTEGQVMRMRATIASFRSSLVSSENQGYTGVSCNGGLLASFTTAGSSSCVGASVTFTAGFISGATYNWDFGDGNVGTGQIVSHTYNSAYSPAVVILTISNGANSATAIQNFYIETCNLINNSETNWYFFDRNAVSFASGIPAYNDSAFTYNTMSLSYPAGVQELSAVQSDSNGQLLFYTDGTTVWNKNHQSINPPGTILHASYSSMNGVIIVPDPASASRYYIITSDCRSSAAFRGLKYTKVQVTGTMAAIIPTEMNVPITVPASLGYQTATNGTALLSNEGITAVRKGDGYWLLASALKNLNSINLVVFNITAGGISYSGEQYIENIPTLSPNQPRPSNIQASANAKKVAFLNCIWDVANSYVYDFDVCNGTFSNRKLLLNVPIHAGEFSPDSRLFYGATPTSILYQFDIEKCNITSKTIANIAPNHFGGMQRGPDNKIYTTVAGTPNITVIHRPNNLCTDLNTNACAYNFAGITMQNNTNVANGLPNMIEAKTVPVFSNSILFNEAKCNTACYAYNFEADICATSYTWNFGDPSSGTGNNTSSVRTPTHIFSAPGSYNVSCVTPSGTFNTTVAVGVAPVITGGSQVCSQNNFIGSYGVIIPNGYSAHWSVTGGTISGLANQSGVVVNWTAPGGVITVVLTNTFNNCTAMASRAVTTLDLTPAISEDTFCFSSDDYATNHSTTIPPGYTALWSFDNQIYGTFTTPTNQANVGISWMPGTAFGYLTLTLTNPNGCTFKTSKTVKDQCACNCLSTKTYNYTKSYLQVNFTSGNSVPVCLGSYSRLRFNWGDGVVNYLSSHTYASGGTYTITITPVITGAYDEAICTGPTYTTTVTVNCKGCLRMSGLSDITIYPNPASSSLNFNVSFKSASPLEVVLRTVDGRELLRKEWKLDNGKHDLQLELPNNISDGMVFVELISGEIKETRTVLIKK